MTRIAILRCETKEASKREECSNVLCGSFAHRATLGSWANAYVSVALRKVPIEGFLCIFYTSLLLSTTSIYARIHPASINVFTHWRHDCQKHLGVNCFPKKQTGITWAASVNPSPLLPTASWADETWRSPRSPQAARDGKVWPRCRSRRGADSNRAPQKMPSFPG